MDITTAIQTIGEAEIIAIAERLVHARSEHPLNGGSRRDSVAAILDEVDELWDAYPEESEERQDDEALDVVITCLRFRRKEYERVKGGTNNA